MAPQRSIFLILTRLRMGGLCRNSLRGTRGVSSRRFTLSTPATSGQACGCEFVRQWAFEWQHLVDGLNAPTSIEPLREWIGGAQEGDYRPVVVDTWMSEIYRSSYLRALHWVVSEGRLPFGDAMVFARELCPVGLLLWRCKPNAKPTWWPNVPPESDGPLDVAPAAIFEAVDVLWNRQKRRQLWDGGRGSGK